MTEAAVVELFSVLSTVVVFSLCVSATVVDELLAVVTGGRLMSWRFEALTVEKINEAEPFLLPSYPRLIKAFEGSGICFFTTESETLKVWPLNVNSQLEPFFFTEIT